VGHFLRCIVGFVLLGYFCLIHFELLPKHLISTGARTVSEEQDNGNGQAQGATNTMVSSTDGTSSLNVSRQFSTIDETFDSDVAQLTESTRSRASSARTTQLPTTMKVSSSSI